MFFRMEIINSKTVQLALSPQILLKILIASFTVKEYVICQAIKFKGGGNFNLQFQGGENDKGKIAY